LAHLHHEDRDNIGGYPPSYAVSRHRRQYPEVLKVETNQHELYTPALTPVQTPKLAVHQSMWAEVVFNPLLGKRIPNVKLGVCQHRAVG